MNKTIPLLLIIALFGAAAYYFFTARPAAVHEQLPPSLSPASAQVEPAPTVKEPLPNVEPEALDVAEPLPPLNESDAPVKAMLGSAVGTDELTQYLVKDKLISRFVALVDSLSSRQVPALINPLKPPKGAFIAERDADRFIMSPDNFTRYDAYITLLGRTDMGQLQSIYKQYYPLLQQAWEENGGKGNFSDRLVGVMDELISTPDVSAEIYLIKPEAVYQFEDPALEALSAGQKILLRMGSANAAVVKQSLAEFRQAIATE